MNEESKYLLKCLKGFVQNENPGIFQDDWEKLIQLADIHSVTGILGYMVMGYPDASNAPVAQIMRRRCLQTISTFSQRAERAKTLIELLNENHIKHLIFKGFIVKDYYPVPELRTFGDIDLLIYLKDRKKCDDLLVSEGFRRKTNWEPVYSYRRGMEYYEVHTDVMEVDVSNHADYKGYYQRVWEHAHLVDGYTWELSPEYHFLYLLTHIAKHISSSGAGIRMYLDIALFIRYFENNLDWNYIQTELKTLAFTDFANMVLTVVREYFGVESPIELRKVDSQILNDFMEYTMAGGIFGRFGRDSGLIYLKRQDKDKETVSRIRTFLYRLFPSAGSLENRYTYLKGKHWLLPFAWVHRFFRTRDSWGNHAQEAQSIMNSDTEEVLKLRRIYKEIGL